jgi:sugar lactone lactonase YvrE
VLDAMDDEPGGIGWLPDGRLLIVAQIGRRVLRLDPEGLHEHADLATLTAGKCNDMVVDAQGRAYVGHFGYDMAAGGAPGPASLVMVTPEGTATVAADGLSFPNGAELSADGRTLVVAESGARRLLAFDVAEDGALSGRRVWADLGEIGPDGICIDAEGAVWVAAPLTNEVVRVREGGEILDRHNVGDLPAFACSLGGPDGRTLFLCCDDMSAPARPDPTGRGRIARIRVDVPGSDPR